MTFSENVLSKYLGKRIFLDSNLLLLLLIGRFQRERIETFKRTSTFTRADFDNLVALTRQFSKVATTPHVLTEVNGMANSLPEYVKDAWSLSFAAAIRDLLEIFDPATEIIDHECFRLFGLTDAAIKQAGSEMLILTQDSRLAAYLRAGDSIASLSKRYSPPTKASRVSFFIIAALKPAASTPQTLSESTPPPSDGCKPSAS
ncbi:MAG TPA: hypothetical protein VIJ79_15840 [Acidobacteriaceae bacterium]